MTAHIQSRMTHELGPLGFAIGNNPFRGRGGELALGIMPDIEDGALCCNDGVRGVLWID
jgi:hypothetical protein